MDSNLTAQEPAGPLIVVAHMRHEYFAAPKHQASPRKAQGPILKPGVNCWRIVHCARAAVLIDGAEYFAHLEQACLQAKNAILIVGWDFDHRIRLRPDDPAGVTLGAFLRSLVETRPELEIRLLIWSVAILHAPSDPIQLLFGAAWANHKRITLKLDAWHPIYAAHHQKLVCIDDSLAFVGGMDLTVRRWDRSVHLPLEPLRKSPEGKAYSPIHDVQMLVDGEAAGAIAQIARERWLKACDERLAPVAQRFLWPKKLKPDFHDVEIGVARTSPQYRGSEEVREIEALTRDCLRSAKRFIYIEAQYMTSDFIGDILSDHLAQSDGPEILILMTHESRGIIERLIMGRNRDGLIRRLKRADRSDRLRVCYPVNGDAQVMMHSKVIIIDDSFLRIGSSNLNNRSMGLDTECDLAVEGRSKSTRRAIASVKRRLIGEHLGVSGDDVAAATKRLGSELYAIDSLNQSERRLHFFEALIEDGPTQTAFGTGLLDPTQPFCARWFRKRTDS